ncbi:type II toxin-antitoxin system VapC family toxin [Thiomonas bhubaneswarensis]|uniref:Predicted nucleic-acid-binding protein, contains PIN domain n=1 Tax=Thiomonas bhubaneswarensis TaxID=339866 RepID=A0A0K6HY53_9BURK|nr:type II toxin-antitoxin system VapC family toxin [Thiomonas bhubaneswarensis]CUA95962.1 Predicted nucleic-acid-binding protein, contains PIN domain [Thiomonas bhubaneswarensis]
MPALDTHVLVRWITNDDAAQCAVIQQLLHATAAAEQRLSVPVTVLLETEWVLRARYGFDRAARILALDAMLSVPELELMDEIAVERALHLFRQDGAPEFADCLHIRLAKTSGQGPLLTIDTRAANVDGALLLTQAILGR